MTAPDPDFATLSFLHAPVGILFAENRVIRDANLHVCEMFGWPRDELTGQSLECLYPSRVEFDRIGANVPDLLRVSGRYADERIMKRRNGELFWCRVRGSTLDVETPFGKTVWTFVDISDLRPSEKLTNREREVAEKLVQGMTAKEIARDLGLSPRTVEIHRGTLLRKLKAKNTLELVARLAGFPFPV